MQGLDAQSLSAASDEILQAVDAAQNLDDLENVRINAAARLHGLTYSQMMGGLIKAGI